MEPNEQEDRRYLELLARSFPNITAAASEIINLSAILQLPKGTEHFISDIHGEYEYFTHILKNASGSIHRKIDDCFGDTLSEEEKNRLALVIYYPRRELLAARQRGVAMEDWYRELLFQLILVSRSATSKYTRSKVRKALPKDFAYIIEELLFTNQDEQNKHEYFDSIIRSIIATGTADDFIVGVSGFINRMVVDKLHILGDIFDRGSGAHLVMDDLCRHHNVDYVWGNHDILWMGAALGNTACIATVLRNCIRYDNFDTVEDGYGVNVRPLAVFAMEQYADDPCAGFLPKHLDSAVIDDDQLTAKIHKAVAVIQFKLEGQIILRHPEYGMGDRLFLHTLDTGSGTVTIEDRTYPLNDTLFPTADPADPYRLSPAEAQLAEQLKASFQHSAKLRDHVGELFENGAMYRICNRNLMYHGCVPMEPDGSFSSLRIGGKDYAGKALLDRCDTLCRKAAYGDPNDPETRDALDFTWFLWCGPASPLNGKNKMSTFERYFIDDPAAWRETKNPYYRFCERRDIAERILREFGVDPETGRIINGHVPVRISRGESPVKAGGKLILIDGGLSKAYQPVTGIGGYTLVFNSHQLYLAEHQPFDPEIAVTSNTDMVSRMVPVEEFPQRIRIRDTDEGKLLQERIDELQRLLAEYRRGGIKQKG